MYLKGYSGRTRVQGVLERGLNLLYYYYYYLFISL